MLRREVASAQHSKSMEGLSLELDCSDLCHYKYDHVISRFISDFD